MTNMAVYYADATVVYSFWLSHGYSPAAACGLVAQADAESSFNPLAVGDHDHAFSVYQDHDDRCAQIKKGCGVDLKRSPTVADALKAAYWELTHTEKFANAQIKAAKTAYDAGFAACKFFERPGSHDQYIKRGKKAEEWAVYFSKHPPK